MLEHKTLSLEARVNVTGAADACTVCGSNRERTPGMTETYLAGTELWVCSECAFEIDEELARFAYDPASRAKRRQRFQDDHFGVCPECGENGGWKNIGRAHWVYCERHGLKWWVGENLISSWREETEADWVQNAAFLARLRETEPYDHRPTLFERMAQRLRERETAIWSRLRPSAPLNDDELPF
jgi:hypothetical protein